MSKFQKYTDAYYRNKPKSERSPAEQAFMDVQVAQAVEYIERRFGKETVFKEAIAEKMAERYLPKPAPVATPEVDPSGAVQSHVLDIFKTEGE